MPLAGVAEYRSLIKLILDIFYLYTSIEKDILQNVVCPLHEDFLPCVYCLCACTLYHVTLINARSIHCLIL